MTLTWKLVVTAIVFLGSVLFGYARSKKKERGHDDLSFLD